MKKIAEKIVWGRYIIFALFILFIVYSVIGISRVEVEYDITAYLDKETDTRKAIDIMNEEFETYPSAQIMIKDVSFEEALALYEKIILVDGVKSLKFENSESYYKDNHALFNISFDDNDEKDIERAYKNVLEILAEKEIYISSVPINNYASQLASEVKVVLLLSVVVILVVLLFTSKSFAEVIAFFAVFGISALLNMGTNFWLGKISFVSNTVCIILQLALAIDYAIILCHRFAEEKENNPVSKEAMVVSLSKAIPEIAGSSLTTIAGLLALTCMSFRLGADLGIILAKSIVFSLLTVFLLMPGILILISPLIDKTKHRNFVPKITPVGKFVVKFRRYLAVFFVVLVGVCSVFSFKTKYVYSTSSVDTHRPTDEMIAKEKIENVFGSSNTFVILVPKEDYEKQKEILSIVKKEELIDSALGIAGIEITLNNKTYSLVDDLNYKDLGEFFGIEENMAEFVYKYYAVEREEEIEDINEYKIKLLDILSFAVEKQNMVKPLLGDNAEMLAMFDNMGPMLNEAASQLIGVNYNRLVLNINAGVESEETFALIERLNEKVKDICPEAIFAGDSMSSYDLNKSFSADIIKINVLTIVFVFIILLLTFRSWGMPIPLVLTIQGAIFINFSRYAFVGKNVFFFVYLIISAIQMGATIDYAIVVANRYKTLKPTLGREEAVITALNDAFPTIITSGTIMAFAGFLIGALVSDPLISSMSTCLGFGVIISVLSVMIVLPAVLMIFDKWIEKTKFNLKFFNKNK